MRARLLPPLAALAVAAAAAAQPPVNPYAVPDLVTAFPDIVPPPPEREAGSWANPVRTYPLMFGSTPRAVPPGAPPITQLRVARLNELAEYLRRAWATIPSGRWSSAEFPLWLTAIDEATSTGADLEDGPAGRVRWLAERVRLAKEVERLTRARTDVAVDPPASLNLPTAHRLAAELDLLRAKELAASDPRPVPPPPAPLPPDVAPEVVFYFPELKPAPPPLTKSEQRFRDGTGPVAEWEARIWRLTAGGPVAFDPTDDTRRKVLKARFNAALDHVRRLRSVNPLAFITHDRYAWRDMVGPLALAGAELETSEAARVPWYRERVGLLWHAELLTGERVAAGTEPPQALNLARARRLGAEIDLILAMGRAAFEPPSAAPSTFRRGSIGAKDETVAFTAFPELKPFRLGDEWPDRPDYEPETRARLPVGTGIIPAYPAGASVETKLRIGRANEGLVSLAKMKQMIAAGKWVAADAPVWYAGLAAAMRARANLEGDPAERERWFARWVVEGKELERLAAARMEAGHDPPSAFELARFHRLGAELALLDFRNPRPTPPAVVADPSPVLAPRPPVRTGFCRR